MSNLHYFQRYSQKENVVTNNTLLLLSRLYAHSILHFEAFLADLLEDEVSESGTLEIGVRFGQQVAGSGKSVPDGVLEQRSFKVVLETKLHSNPNMSQLVRHLKSFGDEECQVLLVLTPARPRPGFLEKLRKAVNDHNQGSGQRVRSVCITFREVIRSYRDALAAHDHEMLSLVADYEDFCATFQKGQLLPRDDYTMRAVPCGKTIEDNREFRVYYQPVDRSYRDHKYVGIYKDKRVHYIGEIAAVVDADRVDDGSWLDTKGGSLPTDQRDRIENAASHARERHGWDITTRHRFFLVESFHSTEFRKESPGGMVGHRYFDLGEVLERESLPPVEEIARLLCEKTW